MVALNVDCQAWEALSMVLRQMTGAGAFANADELETELTVLAIQITADSRRIQAVQASCPKILSEIQQRVAQQPTAANIPDPATSELHARAWLAGLSDSQVGVIKEAIKTDAARRKAQSKRK